MTPLRSPVLAVLALLALALALPDAAVATGTREAGGLDEALYARLLERHTRVVDDLAGVRVDYPAIARSEDWRRLVAGLAEADPSRLTTREAKLAFWIDVYNVLAIDLVARHWPLESIRDIGSLFRPVWKRPAGVVGGRTVTLDEVEHEIIRPLGDPRAHAAVVCASTSCPRLRREPFVAGRLDAQLDDAMRTWMADPGKGLAVDRAARTVTISRIFDWFEEDFEPPGVLAFVARHAPEAEAGWIRENRDGLRVRYLDYDWAVNALP